MKGFVVPTIRIAWHAWLTMAAFELLGFLLGNGFLQYLQNEWSGTFGGRVATFSVFSFTFL